MKAVRQHTEHPGISSDIGGQQPQKIGVVASFKRTDPHLYSLLKHIKSPLDAIEGALRVNRDLFKDSNARLEIRGRIAVRHRSTFHQVEPSLDAVEARFNAVYPRGQHSEVAMQIGGQPFKTSNADRQFANIGPHLGICRIEPIEALT